MKRIRIMFEKYHKDMLMVANNILKNHHDAEDVVQKTFLKIIKYKDEINEMEGEKLSLFLYVATKNMACNELKKKDRKVVDIDSIEEPVSKERDILETIVTRELYLRAKEEIEKLSEPDKSILMLRLYFDVDYKCIADIVNLSELNLRKRYQRVKKKLIEILRKEEY